MKKSFLGYAIRHRRTQLGLSQAELQKLVKNLAIERDTQLSNEEKKVLLNQRQNTATVDGKFILVPVGSTLISKIERGVARWVSKDDISLIAEVLNTDVEFFASLEVDPMKLMASSEYSNIGNQSQSFERTIEFEPEYRQAGVSILSFFSELVETEFSNQSVKVGIMQSGNTVTLRIETPEGELLKEVEQTLNKFGLAVMGKAPINSVSNNQQLVQDLKTRLEVTNLELRLRQEAALTQSSQYEKRITSLESQINNLHNLVGNNLLNQNNLSETIRLLSSATQPSEAFLAALSSISEVLNKSQSKETELQLERSLTDLEKESPGILSRLASKIESIPASIASNMVSPWVQSFILSMPK